MNTNLTAKILFLISLAAYVFSFYAENKALKLPNVSGLLAEISEVPFQEKVDEESYDFEYKEQIYTVQPVADYSLKGLVITQNDISSFADIYHTKDSVDFKDICVIWGSNAENSAYKKMKFWSEPFTCWAQAKDSETNRTFNFADLSNNHLLSRDSEIIERISKVKEGDQILIEGQLINYSKKETPNHIRKTSITREDTRNGACEIIMVDNFEVLKEANISWRKHLKLLKIVYLVCFLGAVVFFFFDTYGVYRI